jgi:hypothetical protein
MVPTRRELVWLLASWFAWAFVALHLHGPHGSLFGYTDHLSHTGMARVFLMRGFDIYRQPGNALCARPPTPAAAAWAERGGCRPAEVCDVRDALDAPGACVAWQEFPHPYPPGAVLSAVPEALVARAGKLSPRALGSLVIVKYLLTAHLLVWAVFRVLFDGRRRDARGLVGGRGWEGKSAWLRWGVFAIVYVEIMKWSLVGFYDPLAIFPIFLGVYFLRERRFADAFVALSASLFLHFRALWYLPLLGAATLGLLERRAWAGAERARTLVKVILGVAMTGASLYAFSLLRSALTEFPDVNPVLWKHYPLNQRAMLDLAVPCALVMLYLASGRHWLLCVTIAWQLFVVVHTPQTMDWHTLFLLPLLGVATLERGNGPMLAAVVVLAVETVVVFVEMKVAFPLPGHIITGILDEWGPWLGR